MPATELDCKGPQPDSAGADTARPRHTNYNQGITPATDVQGQTNSSQPLQPLRVADSSVQVVRHAKTDELVANEIISYLEMCRREGVSLQRGMNFGLGGNHSVILMSVRPGAPYDDRLQEGGTVLVYEGHDQPRSPAGLDPKAVDQPELNEAGRPSQNALFHRAAQEFKSGRREPERVRVYEKIRQGIWSYNGVFHLVDSWRERSGGRQVFKFKLVAVESDEDFSRPVEPKPERRRVIPTAVKLEVWRRDGGKCVVCGAPDELHFDHIVPVSRGGTSAVADNIQLLCARHNLEKRDQIL